MMQDEGMTQLDYEIEKKLEVLEQQKKNAEPKKKELKDIVSYSV